MAGQQGGPVPEHKLRPELEPEPDLQPGHRTDQRWPLAKNDLNLSCRFSVGLAGDGELLPWLGLK